MTELVSDKVTKHKLGVSRFATETILSIINSRQAKLATGDLVTKHTERLDRGSMTDLISDKVTKTQTSW